MVAFKSCFLLLVDDVHGLCREPRATHGSFDGDARLYFTNRVINTCNFFIQFVASANTIDCFKSIFGKMSCNKDVISEFSAEIQGTISQSECLFIILSLNL